MVAAELPPLVFCRAWSRARTHLSSLHQNRRRGCCWSTIFRRFTVPEKSVDQSPVFELPSNLLLTLFVTGQKLSARRWARVHAQFSGLKISLFKKPKLERGQNEEQDLSNGHRPDY